MKWKKQMLVLAICMVLLVSMGGAIVASASAQFSDGITVSEEDVPISIVPESSKAVPIDGWNMDKTVDTGSSYGGSWFGMKYMPEISYDLKRVELIAGTGTGEYIIQLRPDAGGRPHDTSVLRETSFTQVNTVSWQGADFATSYPISAGTTYWIVINPVPGSQASISTSGTIITHYWGDDSTLPDGPWDDCAWMAKFYAEAAEESSVSITTDCFEYSSGDTMIRHLEIDNPTASPVTFNWHLGVPQLAYWGTIASAPIPAGFSYSDDLPFPVGDWGSTPFGMVWYVELTDGTGEVLDSDAATCAYSPDVAVNKTLDAVGAIEKSIRKAGQ